MLFIRGKQQRRDKAIGLDLGTSQLKAAVVRRHRDGLELMEYAVRQVPVTSPKPYSDPQYAEQLQQLVGGLKTTDRHVFVTISCRSAMVCQAEFPPAPIEDIKTALKLNSAGYLHRDFSAYYLDAFELKKNAEGGKAGNAGAKTKVLIGGAQKEEVDACRAALVAAKIRPEVIELAAVSVVNAFQVSHPELNDEVTVLVDIGSRSTSINFLRQGLPLITRITHFGGFQLSEYIAQTLTLETAQAEQQKVQMPDPVRALVKTALSPLARELRSSVDFFERQHDCHVSRAFACGGSACSAALLEMLSEVVGLRIERWSPIDKLQTSHFNGESAQLAEVAPALAAAIGAAAAQL